MPTTGSEPDPRRLSYVPIPMHCGGVIEIDLQPAAADRPVCQEQAVRKLRTRPHGRGPTCCRKRMELRPLTGSWPECLNDRDERKAAVILGQSPRGRSR